jgi:transcriptional regulator with XRE-family HTH domain
MPMGDGGEAVEGEAWSAYLKRMTSRPGWSVARLARDASIHRGTIFDYISGKKKGVTVATVTAIADALGDDPANALKAAAGVASRDPVDEVIQLVSDDDDLPAQTKMQIIKLILDRRDQQRAGELEEARRLIDMFKATG